RHAVPRPAPPHAGRPRPTAPNSSDPPPTPRTPVAAVRPIPAARPGPDRNVWPLKKVDPIHANAVQAVDSCAGVRRHHGGHPGVRREGARGKTAAPLGAPPDPEHRGEETAHRPAH